MHIIAPNSNKFELCYMFFRSKYIIHVYRGCVNRLILLIQNVSVRFIWNITVEVFGYGSVT